MKLTLKILAPVILLFVVYLVWFAIEPEGTPIAASEQSTAITDDNVHPPEVINESDNSVNESRKTTSEAWDNDVELSPEEISHDGTFNEPGEPDYIIPQIVNYEDDWCNARTQLSPSDYERSQAEINEFILSRGGAKIADVPEQLAHRPDLLINNEYVESYQEASLEELRQLIEQGDKMAMVTFAQRGDAELAERNSIAKKLLVSGDTQYGLGQLVSSHMNSALLRYKEKGGVDPDVKKHLMQALALVAYGLERRDLHALSVYLTYTGKEEQRLFDLDPDAILSEDELALIPGAKAKLWDDIEKERLMNHLPSLTEEELPRMAHKRFEEGLAMLHSIYPEYMDSSKILGIWRGDHLRKNECVESPIEFNRRYLDFLKS